MNLSSFSKRGLGIFLRVVMYIPLGNIPASHTVSLVLVMYTCCDSAMPLLSCICLCITANGVRLHLLAPSLAQCCFFGASCYCWGILSRERHPLQQFHSKRKGGLIFEGKTIFGRLQYRY